MSLHLFSYHIDYTSLYRFPKLFLGLLSLLNILTYQLRSALINALLL